MGWGSILGFTGSWVSLVSMALGLSVSGDVLDFYWVLLLWVVCDWFLLCDVVVCIFLVFFEWWWRGFCWRFWKEGYFSGVVFSHPDSISSDAFVFHFRASLFPYEGVFHPFVDECGFEVSECGSYLFVFH